MDKAAGIRELPASTSIREMKRYSAGQHWENLEQKRREAESQEFKAQRAAKTRAVQEQIGGGFQTLKSVSDALPVGGPQQLQVPYPGFGGRHGRQRDGLSELEAPWSPPPEYQQQAPPTPGEAPDVGDHKQITQLQKEVTHKENKIKSLEYELEVERNKKRRLQAERHEAVDAQRRAEDEFYKLKRQVANLDELLAGSTKKERELEIELDVARIEITELKRQLHEEQCRFDSDIRARDMRERRIMQQVEDTHCALKGKKQRKKSPESEVADRNGQADTLAADAPNRARRSSKSTSGRTLICRPNGKTHRAVYMFT